LRAALTRGSQRTGPAAALLAAIALAGCGSGQATKASFVSKANSVCSALQEELRGVNATQGQVEAKLEEGVKVLQKYTDKLRKIPLPAHESVPREWLHYRELVAANAQRVVQVGPSNPIRKIAAEEEFKARQRAIELARSYGLTDCTSV
jgi:hypothetical protein